MHDSVLRKRALTDLDLTAYERGRVLSNGDIRSLCQMSHNRYRISRTAYLRRHFSATSPHCSFLEEMCFTCRTASSVEVSGSETSLLRRLQRFPERLRETESSFDKSLRQFYQIGIGYSDEEMRPTGSWLREHNEYRGMPDLDPDEDPRLYERFIADYMSEFCSNETDYRH